MKKKIRLILFNYILVCALLVSIELLLQIGFRVIKGYWYWGSVASPQHAELFEIHPYLVGRLKQNAIVTQEDIQISVTNVNTRSTGANPEKGNQVRIGVYGGSTTFCTGVSDDDSWPWQLQEKLGDKYTVINYGVPGYSTVENIIQLALLDPQERLDYIIIYSGWNDLRNYYDPALGADYYSHGIQQYHNLGIGIPRSTFDRLKEVFVSFKLIAKIKSNHVNPESAQDSGQPDAYVDKLYRRNLNTLKLLANKMESKVIFVPQVLNYSYFENNPNSQEPWTKRIKNADMMKLMTHLNTQMNNLKNVQDSGCFILDEVLDFSWQEKHFVDEGHFSAEGGDVFSGILVKHLQQ